ncbi:MAG TPA: hypothetical protein VHP11_01530 [Tepidisphaeraceae bacterium]|nr:hypothetical protein [Tepidisphaeraceae bacterium]
MRTIETFKTLEQQQQPLQMPSLELLVLPIGRMGNRMRQTMRFKILRHAVDVLGQRLKLGMVLAREAPDQNMHLAAIVGEPAGQLFAHQDIGVIRQTPNAVHAIVIGEGDQVHAPRFGLGIHRLGLAV